MKLKTYLWTFPAWLQTIVESFLMDKKLTWRIFTVLDGLIVFESGENMRTLVDYPIFSNLFLVLKTFQRPKGSADMFMQVVVKGYDVVKPAIVSKDMKTFRIIHSSQNQLASIPDKMHRKLEKLIERVTRLQTNRSLPDTEFWFIRRSEKIGYFVQRLNTHKSKSNKLQRGELAKSITYAMCYIAGGLNDKVIADPFFGRGGLAKTMTRFRRPARVYVSDIDKNLVAQFSSSYQSVKKHVADATNLDFIKEASVDAVVTDPPWWLFEAIDDIKSFYENMLQEIIRILSKKWVAVLLIGAREEFESVVASIGVLTNERVADILVSGKKASIYLLKRG